MSRSMMALLCVYSVGLSMGLPPGVLLLDSNFDVVEKGVLLVSTQKNFNLVMDQIRKRMKSLRVKIAFLISGAKVLSSRWKNDGARGAIVVIAFNQDRIEKIMTQFLVRRVPVGSPVLMFQKIDPNESDIIPEIIHTRGGSCIRLWKEPVPKDVGPRKTVPLAACIMDMMARGYISFDRPGDIEAFRGLPIWLMETSGSESVPLDRNTILLKGKAE